MGRTIGTPNQGERITKRIITYRSHRKGQRTVVWHYDGKLLDDPQRGPNLYISKIHGPIAGHAAELDKAIKAECKRLGATVHLDDPVAATEMLNHLDFGTIHTDRHTDGHTEGA